MKYAYFSHDTITAIATSMAGDGGVGIIRLSGPSSVAAAQKICTGLESSAPRYLHRITVVDPATNKTVDDGLAVFFADGLSFTGEQVVELQLHGGRYLLQIVLKLLIETGMCRQALPGEFSFRAVRNGKLNLSQAGAIAQVITARSDYEVEAARRNLGGQATAVFDALIAQIRNLLVQVELSIDFVDQDVEVISQKKLAADLAILSDAVEKLWQQLQAARRIARGVQVSLVGSPNAGKSTLFNAILSEDRAIVSPEAGTTRDVIAEEFSLGPYRVRLSDTAGLRDTESLVEKEGIDRAKWLMANSDVVVFILDPTQNIDAQWLHYRELQALTKDLLLVQNKADLKTDFLEIQDSLPVSALRKEGLADLLGKIGQVLDRKLGLGLNCFLPTEFQLQMIAECRCGLLDVTSILNATGVDQPELISVSLSKAARALSDLVGQTTPDTVLEKIFSEFCIGK